MDKQKEYKFEAYEFKKYQNNYPDLFRKEKYKLKKFLPDDAKIEHFGSTAVPGLGGKGIIDIFITIKDRDIKNAIAKIQKNGYMFFSGGGSGDGLFKRDYKYGGKIRRVHLHLACHGSSIFEKVMAVSNCLKSNKKAAEKYAEIKKEAAKIANGDGKIYREYKEKFIKNLEKEAVKDLINEDVGQGLKEYKAGKCRKIGSLEGLN